MTIGATRVTVDLVHWQHVNLLAAANYLRERIARDARDARAQEVYDGLLDVLDPSRREARLKRAPTAKRPRR